MLSKGVAVQNFGCFFCKIAKLSKNQVKSLIIKKNPSKIITFELIKNSILGKSRYSTKIYLNIGRLIIEILRKLSLVRN